MVPTRRYLFERAHADCLFVGKADEPPRVASRSGAVPAHIHATGLINDCYNSPRLVNEVCPY